MICAGEDVLDAIQSGDLLVQANGEEGPFQGGAKPKGNVYCLIRDSYIKHFDASVPRQWQGRLRGMAKLSSGPRVNGDNVFRTPPICEV